MSKLHEKCEFPMYVDYIYDIENGEDLNQVLDYLSQSLVEDIELAIDQIQSLDQKDAIDTLQELVFNLENRVVKS